MINKLTHKQRFYNTFNRKGYDRISVKHFAEPVVNEELANYLGACPRFHC